MCQAAAGAFTPAAEPSEDSRLRCFLVLQDHRLGFLGRRVECQRCVIAGLRIPLKAVTTPARNMRTAR